MSKLSASKISDCGSRHNWAETHKKPGPTRNTTSFADAEITLVGRPNQRFIMTWTCRRSIISDRRNVLSALSQVRQCLKDFDLAIPFKTFRGSADSLSFRNTCSPGYATEARQPPPHSRFRLTGVRLDMRFLLPLSETALEQLL
jgi:hypothetical protein